MKTFSKRQSILESFSSEKDIDKENESLQSDKIKTSKNANKLFEKQPTIELDLHNTGFSKAFQKSFIPQQQTKVMKNNSQMAEWALLSFIKIIYEINTQPIVKKYFIIKYILHNIVSFLICIIKYPL